MNGLLWFAVLCGVSVLVFFWNVALMLILPEWWQEVEDDTEDTST